MNTDRPTCEHTFELLNELCLLGFDDAAYGALHHFREIRKRRDTMAEHKAYLIDRVCTGFLQRNKGNHEVQLRLELVLKNFNTRGLKADAPEVFLQLANEAYQVIPYKSLASKGKRGQKAVSS